MTEMALLCFALPCNYCFTEKYTTLRSGRELSLSLEGPDYNANIKKHENLLEVLPP